MSCCGAGPGYASPMDAMTKGPREKLIYVTVTRHESKEPDYLATVDVDPDSKTFSQVLHRTLLGVGDEAHHSGWNACSSCFGDAGASRSHLVLPCLASSRLYIVDTASDPRAPKLASLVSTETMSAQGLSFPHTAHCLADGNILVSTLGDEKGQAKGSFLLLDAKTFQVKGTWSANEVGFGYDYWYQPRHNVMISTAWGTPNLIKGGFNPSHVTEGGYGHHLYVFDWKEKKLQQTIELDATEAAMPLEIRFKHDPDSTEAFVGCALSSNVFRIHPKGDESWTAEKVVDIPAKKVKGWALPEMPGLITDILISLDDRFLFLSLWLHGDVRCYDIQDPAHPKLVGQVFLGGAACTDSRVEVEGESQPAPLTMGGRRVEGGPQMLQLSLDGRRLYVTNSLYSVWDNQFYPNLAAKGGAMLQVDVGEDGSLRLNRDFLVDFASEPGGPALPHEMRYPGGDCTSDIWI